MNRKTGKSRAVAVRLSFPTISCGGGGGPVFLLLSPSFSSRAGIGLIENLLPCSAVGSISRIAAEPGYSRIARKCAVK